MLTKGRPEGRWLKITGLLRERGGAETDRQTARPPDAREGVGPGLFTRSTSDRVLTGVAGGLGQRLGVDPILLRVGLLVLASAAGAGLLAYLLAWVVSSEPSPGSSEAHRPPPASVVQTTAFACVLVGTLLLLRTGGVWLADAITWPLALAGVGSALLWSSGDEATRARWGRLVERLPGGPLLAGRAALWRVGAGGVLLVAGLGGFLSLGEGLPLAVLGPVLVAVAVTAAGLAVLVGPWGWRLARQLSEERVERARSQERAEVAAHLHDSVLQTLALIQRSSDPQEAAALARTQERDLRAWLYGTGAPAGSLRAAVEEAAATLETRHRTPIDVVVVGDTPLDGPLQALVQAASEAMANAARHSAADRVSVYVEVEADAVTAYVTDQGVGFVPAAVPADRRGIAESIRGRMARHGGEATILSEPGEGTEVALRLPRSNGTRGAGP